MSCVKPQLENVPATSPRHAYRGAGVFVGCGGVVGLGVGRAVGLLVGLGVGWGVLVGGTGVSVGGNGVSVGGTGVKVSVGGSGVSVGKGVSVGVGVSVGIGVNVGVRVTVKVGLGVLVGVGEGSARRPISELLPQANMPASIANATARITTRFLIPFINPPDLIIRWPDTVLR